MSEAAQEWLLDFADSDADAGFRLHRVEVLNWGTFDRRVWSLRPGGANALLTGDIGSGKSTLVDAVTTLLVPAQRITYNKAAGADTRERSLRSYVFGHYRAERGEVGQAAKAVALRDANSYSVILGHFRNEALDHSVTLAQVFWIKDPKAQPERFYVVADRALGIVEDFSDFGSDINRLRKRLRDAEQVELHDTFPPYGRAFRRRFGLAGEQALELFSQTVSLKSVGNLTEFVRSHMLEPFPVDERIEQLIGHFDDLDRAHQAVVTARRQVEALGPLIEQADEHAAIDEEVEGLRACREALPGYFASLRSELLVERIERRDREIERAGRRAEALDDERRQQQGRRDEIRQAIAESGGDRIERLKTAIAEHQRERGERERHAANYRAVLDEVGWEMPADEERFAAHREAAREELDGITERRESVQNGLTEATVALQSARSEHDELTTELESLRQRRSNLPAAMLTLRQRLCADVGVGEDVLPFVGELLQVREDERAWEGAVERLLHGFGLSLLVPDAHYGDVAAWVDRTHLRGRLVYFRVRPPRDHRLPDLHPQSLVRRLVVQPDSEHYAWLERELAERFDYACCDDLAAFRREKRAITRSGQIKAGGERHEKDDRHRIDDRSRYILGWSNEAKIAALEEQAREVERRVQAAAARVAEKQDEQRGLDGRVACLNRLLAFTDYRQLDAAALVVEIDRLDAERRALESESDTLRALQAQLDDLDGEIAETEEKLKEAEAERTRASTRREEAAGLLATDEATLAATDETVQERDFPQLESLRGEAIGQQKLTIEGCDNRQREFRDWLQSRIDTKDKRLRTLSERMVDGMRRYQNEWPQQTAEIDCGIEAIGEYRAILERLRADDLPRFEARFKELLNENTVREIAGFRSRLEGERERIRERVERINRSLAAIDYNPNRYIRLLAENSTDAEIRDFLGELRACTEGAVGADETWSEEKFLQVRRIIERFRGRDGSTDIDRRWRRKVTDVRNWYVFSASERWREDDSEHEHYSDSGGKSGGQKEKLAYTVLAASLAYQFGLEQGERRSRSFRFVVIDEAFGRGSDESARYGLELFARLNLQLLIVTPLQKIHIIEPFVASVGFVHNDGRESLLRNLTIEEYVAERDARTMVKMQS